MFFDPKVEGYDYAETAEQMDDLLREMGFADERGNPWLNFYSETGVHPEELIGVRFCLIHNRVFTAD